VNTASLLPPGEAILTPASLVDSDAANAPNAVLDDDWGREAAGVGGAPLIIF
jgi:hypothetical protein